MNYWYENGPVKDVTIQHCTFHNCGIPVCTACGFTSTENAPFYHENIRLIENTIHLNGRNLLDMQDVNGILLRGNTVTGIPEGRLPVLLKRCCGVTLA